jgi:hypothetical protein
MVVEITIILHRYQAMMVVLGLAQLAQSSMLGVLGNLVLQKRIRFTAFICLL